MNGRTTSQTGNTTSTILLDQKIIVDYENTEAEEILPKDEKIDNESDNEINSDGSGEAFEQTEEVTEDNFDDLKEK